MKPKLICSCGAKVELGDEGFGIYSGICDSCDLAWTVECDEGEDEDEGEGEA